MMEAAPCAVCGTTGGHAHVGRRKPIRRSGEPFGIDGMLCFACYGPRMRLAKGKKPRVRKEALTQEERERAGAYWLTACKVANRFRREYPRVGRDFDGAAAMGIFRAAKTWNPGKPYAFATTVRWYVKRECQNLARSQQLKGWTDRDDAPILLAIDDCTPNSDDRGRATDEFRSNDPPAEKQVEDKEFLEAILDLLPEHQAKMLRLVYWGGLSIGDAGRQIGLKQRDASRIRSEAIAALRRDARVLEVAS